MRPVAPVRTRCIFCILGVKSGKIMEVIDVGE